MSRKKSSNVAASVKTRLFNLSMEKGEDYQLILTKFAIERLLYRLSVSEHARQFVIKGAMLFEAWTEEKHRPTKDLDLLGYGDDSEARLAKIFREICQEKVELDGLEFDADSIRVEPIREGQEYQGKRIKFFTRLERTRIRVQVDIGFGDVVKPGVQKIAYPVMLDDFPVPIIRAYPKEAMVAEKLETLVRKGLLNSRMKDFYDLHAMAAHFDFEGPALREAVEATFRRRKTGIPEEIPPALSDEFIGDRDKQRQWKAFLGRNRLEVEGNELAEMVKQLRKFLMPVLAAISGARPLKAHWSDGAWRVG